MVIHKIEDTSHCFKAYSPDADGLVKLELKFRSVKFRSGKATGNIWKAERGFEEGTTLREVTPADECEEDFSRGSIQTKYRLQRFYSYWPEEDHARIVGGFYLPKFDDQFSSQSNVVFCKSEAI